jgi:hypothetical protein
MSPRAQSETTVFRGTFKTVAASVGVKDDRSKVIADH